MDAANIVLITCSKEQLRKIRDDAFECAAKLVEERLAQTELAPRMAKIIRNCKLEPITITFK